MRPGLEIADIVRRFGTEYIEKYRPSAEKTKVLFDNCKISISTLVFSADGRYFSIYSVPNRRTISAISRPGRMVTSGYKAYRADCVVECVCIGPHANKSLL